MKYKVAIIEDDYAVSMLMNTILVTEDKYIPQVFNSGMPALEQIKKNPPDILLLDLNLPDMDGMEICRILRKNRKTKHLPIIMVTARGQERERVEGLHSGADDYMPKPFSYDELLARIEAVLRRVDFKGDVEKVLRSGKLKLNASKRTVTVKGKLVKLTKKEFSLLALLMKKPGRLLKEDYILERVWHDNCSVSSNTLDVSIHRLKKKLGKDVSSCIKNVRGMGYKFVPAK